jgi:nitrite reductase/ring-hydroxylating ferredoxin subunit
VSGRLSAGTVLARMAELTEGCPRVVDLNPDEFPPLTAILVREAGQVHAFLNRCPHAGRPLGMGRAHLVTPDGELLQCLAHGALFEKASGLCVAGPCLDESLRRLPVAVLDGEVRLAEDLDTRRLARGPW